MGKIMVNLTSIFLILCVSSVSGGVIGYDCESAESNITIISTQNVKSCLPPNDSVESKPMFVQMLQRKSFRTIKVKQCKITVHQVIYYCGSFSYTSLYPDSHVNRYHDVTSETCRNIFRKQSWTAPNGFVIDGVKPGIVLTASNIVHGTVDTKASCSGADFSVDGVTYTSSVMSRTYTIIIQEVDGVLDYESNKISLPSGTHCPANEETCLDLTHGRSGWALDQHIYGNCGPKSYDVLYEGRATEMTQVRGDVQDTMIMINGTDKIAAFTLGKPMLICGQLVYNTEDPKIIFTKDHLIVPLFFIKDKLDPIAVDIFSYFNSKLVYYDKMTKLNTEEIYNKIKYEQCHTRLQGLTTMLALANINSEEFAYALTKTPGYTAFVAGEVVYLRQCVAVSVEPVPSGKYCYNEMLVNYTGNPSLKFMKAKSHILSTHGTQVECSPNLQTLFQINGIWRAPYSNNIEVKTPEVLDPNIKSAYEVLPMVNLAANGIYSNNEIMAYNRRVAMSREIGPITAMLARSANGMMVDNQGASFSGLLSIRDKEDLHSYFLAKTWGRFVFIGEITSGCIGLYVMLRVIVYCFTTGFNALGLYRTHGCGWKLIAAPWSAASHWVNAHTVHRRAKQQDEQLEIVATHVANMIDPPTKNNFGEP